MQAKGKSVRKPLRCSCDGHMKQWQYCGTNCSSVLYPCLPCLCGWPTKDSMMAVLADLGCKLITSVFTSEKRKPVQLGANQAVCPGAWTECLHNDVLLSDNCLHICSTSKCCKCAVVGVMHHMKNKHKHGDQVSATCSETDGRKRNCFDALCAIKDTCFANNLHLVKTSSFHLWPIRPLVSASVHAKATSQKLQIHSQEITGTISKACKKYC